MQLSLAIRRGYIDYLQGQITYNGETLMVLDAFAAPEDQPYPYILIGSQTNNQRGAKKCFNYNSTVVVDIVTGSINPIGRAQAEIIAENVEDIIINSTFVDIDLSVYGYQIVSTNKENDTELSNRNNKGYMFRKLLTFNHLISKL